MATNWLPNVAIGVLVVLSIAGLIVYLSRKGYFEPDVNEDAPDEREELAETVGSDDFRIPYRSRIGAWSGPYKVFVASLALLALAVGAVTYQVMRTGSPVQQYITREIQMAIVGVAGIGAGVRLKAIFDGKIATADVIYEREGREPLVDRVPYAKTGERRREGLVTAPEVATNRLLGLFWKYRQVGSDRKLRGTDTPLSDVITQGIPDHAIEKPDGSGWIIPTHSDGERVLSGATSTADVTYEPPNSLSHEEKIEYRERLERKNARLQAMQATKAELYQQVKKMRKKIENEEYHDREELKSDLDDFAAWFNEYSRATQRTTRNGDDSALDQAAAEEAER